MVRGAGRFLAVRRQRCARHRRSWAGGRRTALAIGGGWRRRRGRATSLAKCHSRGLPTVGGYKTVSAARTEPSDRHRQGPVGRGRGVVDSWAGREPSRLRIAYVGGRRSDVGKPPRVLGGQRPECDLTAATATGSWPSRYVDTVRVDANSLHRRVGLRLTVRRRRRPVGDASRRRDALEQLPAGESIRTTLWGSPSSSECGRTLRLLAIFGIAPLKAGAGRHHQ